MTRNLFLILMLGCSLGFGTSQAEPAIWQVKGKHNTLYLLGTIHMLPASEPLAGNIQTAYRESEQLLMEIDMDDLDALGMQGTMLELGLLPADEDLDTLLDVTTRTRLHAAAEKLGIDPALIARFQPWLAALMLEQQQMTQLGFATEGGIEMQLVQRAAQDHKTIQGLETITQQLNLFAQLDRRAQITYLRQTLDELNDSPRELQQMLQAWRSGNVQQLQALLNKGLQQSPTLFARLTAERNQRWVTLLKPLLDRQQDDYLVAVGALHMVGDQGLVTLLKRAGYQVTLQ